MRASAIISVALATAVLAVPRTAENSLVKRACDAEKCTLQVAALQIPCAIALVQAGDNLLSDLGCAIQVYQTIVNPPSDCTGCWDIFAEAANNQEGQIALNPGNNDPNSGNNDPNSGNSDPNSGNNDPNSGNSDPNSGTNDPSDPSASDLSQNKA